MPIFDELSKKLSSVAQDAVQMSKGFAESAKASFAINSEEHEIEKSYKAIGRWYYETKGATPEDIAGEIDIIETSIRKIREIQENAEEVKSAASQPAKQIPCPACGMEMDENSEFCPSCHVMMPPDEMSLREETVCSECGCVANGPFCSQCGAKL